MDLDNHVLLWRPEAGAWDAVDYEGWLAFRGISSGKEPLQSIGEGPHNFVVLISTHGEIVNIILHKYVADERGSIVDANVYELTDEENEEWSRYMEAKEMSAAEMQRLRDIQTKASKALVLSAEAFRKLKTALPMPIKLGSAAQEFMRGGGLRAE